jgi:hypothetical protein
MYDSSPSPFANQSPDIRELLERKSVEEHEAAQELAKLASQRLEREQKSLAEGLAERLAESDAVAVNNYMIKR